MTKAGERIIEGAKEALAIAKSEKPAARIHIKGHAYMPAADHAAEVERLEREVARCHARLEIDHCYRLGEGDEMVREEIPCGERASFPDGIAARDETIKLLDANAEAAEARIAELEAALAEADKQAVKVEGLLDAHISWDGNVPPGCARALRATGGEMACRDCARPNPVWFAPNKIWNKVMGGPEATDDPGGFICPCCFIARAEATGFVPTGWEIRPEVAVSDDAIMAATEGISRHYLGQAASKDDINYWRSHMQQVAEIALRAALSTPDGWQSMEMAKPVAWRVHDFHIVRQPVKARGHYPEPTEYLYPADREDDAKAMAKIVNGTCSALYQRAPNQ